MQEKLTQAAAVAANDRLESEFMTFYFENVLPGVLGWEPPFLSTTGTVVDTATRPAGNITAAEIHMSTVWLSLVFRMLAWLFLHEFNPLDRMIERTEYMYNRLPVYIG